MLRAAGVDQAGPLWTYVIAPSGLSYTPHPSERFSDYGGSTSL